MNGYSNTDDIKYASDCQALNDLRNAMYNFEYKAVNNLQLINGGGAAVLVGFMSRPDFNMSFTLKCIFMLSISSFTVGLLASFMLSVIYPSFLEARYRQYEMQNIFKEQDILRKRSMYISIGCFIFAIVLSAIGWIVL